MGKSHSRLWTITIPLSLPLLAFAYYRWRQRRLGKIEHYEEVGHVTGLFIYPVKSCAGISLETADCLTAGLQFDRFVYMFVYLFVCWNVMDLPLLCKRPLLCDYQPLFTRERRKSSVNIRSADITEVSL